MTQSQPPIEAKGTTGTVVFDGAMVSLVRTGMTRLTVGKGTKRIPVQSITAVQWKNAGPLMNGYIQFTIAGGIEARSQFGRATVDAAKDENSVVFRKGQQPQFEVVRDAIESAITGRQGGSTAQVPQQASATDRMAQLQNMLQQGMISQDEYDTKRQQILGQL